MFVALCMAKCPVLYHADFRPCIVHHFQQLRVCRVGIIEELANDYEGQVIVGKCDIEEDEDLPMRFGVRNIPTILFIKNGEVVDKQVGAAARPVFEEKLKSIL